jgi:GNAT superfamily N-acetyltransferase
MPDRQSTISDHASSVIPAGAGDRRWIHSFLRERWGADFVVVHGEVIEAADLPALTFESRQGLATYRLLGKDAELVTLDAVSAGLGIGTALVETLAATLIGQGCERLWLTTTNDKLAALRFYQRRGFRLIQARVGAVDKARKLKPMIPLVGEHGIAMQDEIDLCRLLATVEVRNCLPPWSRKPAGAA